MQQVKLKQTEIGVIPEDWTITTLETKGSFKKGKGIRKDEVKDEGLPCIRYGEIYTYYNNYARYLISSISKETAEQSQLVKTGDLLFAGSGETAEEIGKCVAYIGTDKAYAGGDIIIFSPNEGNSIFLGYLMNQSLVVTQKSRLGQGDAVVHIYSTHLKQILIPFPKTEEQSSIASVLSDTDVLIEQLDNLIVKKKNIKQGAMQELLTGKRRLPGFKGEWEVTTLGKVANFEHGFGLSKAELNEDGLHKCIHYGQLFTEYKELIKDTKSRTDTTSNVVYSQENDVLMPTSDVTPRGLATASCIKEKGIVLGGGILIIRLHSGYDGVFLSYFVTQNKNSILRLVKGSTVFHLYASDLSNLEISFPEYAEQKAIASIIIDMNSEIEELQQKRDKYLKLKAGMMQQLLTGRIRLKC